MYIEERVFTHSINLHFSCVHFIILFDKKLYYLIYNCFTCLYKNKTRKNRHYLYIKFNCFTKLDQI